MEPQTLIVAAIVIVVSAILVYLISVFGIKEKSFDEAMAEQKRRQEEEMLKSRSEKKAEKDTKKKWRKKVEKSKEKVIGFSQQETQVFESVVHHTKTKGVEYEPDPEIINPEDFPIKEHKSTKSKNKKTKSILLNKDEKAPVANDVEVPHLFHRATPPKDEVELKHKTEEKKSHKKHEERISQQDSKVSETSRIEVREEITVKSGFQTSATTVINTNVEKSSEKKKSKTPSGAGDADTLPTSRLISCVKAAVLTDAEVQTFINILLNKQQGSAASIETWSKKSQKGDPVALLRKQLEEKERSLQEEQQLAMTANNKLKETKQEMSQEKSRYALLEKSSRDKIALQLKEIQALSDRMQKTHEAHRVEKSGLLTRVSQMENQMGPGNQNLLQKLTDENKQLKDSLTKIKAESVPTSEVKSMTQKVQLLESELGKTHVKLNATENSRKTLEDKVTGYEEQLRSFESGHKDTEDVLSKKLEEVNQQLRKTESQKSNFSTEMQKAQSECQALKTQLKELERTLTGATDHSKGLQTKLEASEQQKVTLQTSVQSMEKKLEEYRKEQAEKESELNRLKVENRDLSDQLRKESERQQGEGQEAPSQPDGAPNGHVNHEPKQDAFQLKEKERLLSEKEKEIVRLESELNSQKDEINRLSEEVEKQKKKNNEIREKNWKAMEALDKAEKSVEEKIGKAIKTTMEKDASQLEEFEIYDKSVLQRIFPDIAPSTSLPHKDWMKTFEKEAVSYVSTLSSSASKPAVDAVVEQRLSQMEDLEKRVKVEVQKREDVTSQLTQAEQKVLDATNRLNESENRSQELESRLSERESDNRGSARCLEEAERQRRLGEEKLQELVYEKNDMESRLKDLESQINRSGTSSSQISSLEIRLKQTEQQRDKLESQIKEYRAVLSETEDKLQQLQSSVESEEQKWLSRIQTTETELVRAREELTVVKEEYKKVAGNTEDLDHLDFTYRCVEKSLGTIVEEMEEKIVLLETELKTAELKHTSLQEELADSKETVSSLRLQVENSSSSSNLDDTVNSLQQQLKTVEQQKAAAETRVVEIEKEVTKLQLQLKEGSNSEVDISTLKKSITDLQTQLEDEKKKNKDLSSKVVRLNGTVKIGQDALAEEQRLVKQLQDQLELKNGTGPEDPDSLKAKLIDTQKQLEREIMANRQLSQRLAASAGNDVGTSV